MCSSRITTRLSPEEMTFDPAFGPAPQTVERRLRLAGTQLNVDGCKNSVVEEQWPDMEAALAVEPCADLYCGQGVCGIDEAGRAGCICDAGFVARHFTEVDGEPSITCVPEVGTVQFDKDIMLADACDGATCLDGTCRDVGGVATCECNAGTVAVRGGGATPACVTLEQLGPDAGGRDLSGALAEFDICKPAPPTCRAGGWLDKVRESEYGVDCHPEPSAARFEVPPAPTCDDVSTDGGREPTGGGDPDQNGGRIVACGCREGGAPAGVLGMLALLLLRGGSRRRKAA